MLILGIDTSGRNASVALYENGVFLAQKSVLTRLTHSQIIMPMVDEILKSAEKTIEDVDLFAVANGPGSYTGLRIGVSAVKAFGFAGDKPCIGVSVLKGLCYSANPRYCEVLCVMKARGNLAYTAAFKSENGIITQIMEDKIADINEIADFANQRQSELAITGDCAEEIISIIDNENAYLVPKHLHISSAQGICLAAEHCQTQTANALEAAYFEVTKAEKELKSKTE